MRLNDLNCSECRSYTFCKKYERDNKSRVTKDGVWKDCMSPIRKCQHVLIENYSGLNGDVIEIGCGSSRKGGFIKKAVLQAGGNWTGIDINQSDLTTVVCDVGALPFADESFDVAIGNQTMEHWPDVSLALREVHRILRVGGRVLLNVPIHLHGSKPFVAGDFDTIESFFTQAKLIIDIAETWRNDKAELNDYLPGESKRHLTLYKVKDKVKSAYVLNIIARKQNE